MRPYLEVSLAGAGVVWIHQCAGCGFRQVRPRVAGDRLRALYPSDYFDAGTGLGYEDYGRQFYRRQREAYFLCRRLEGVAPDGPWLEVGCALGFLLRALRASGVGIEGLDVSPFAAYYARTRFDLDVHAATLEEMRYPAGRFVVVIQKDVLEHVSDPRGHLAETCRVMRPGGYLWLITPNGEANLRPLLRAAALRDEDGAHPDVVPLLDQGHLSFFSFAHLQRLFSASGFECLTARSIGVRRGLRALGRLPGQRRFARTIARGRPTSIAPEAAAADRDAAYEAVARRIDASIAAWRRPLQTARAYYHLHRVFKQLDTLPASIEVGYDFEFLLRRR